MRSLNRAAIMAAQVPPDNVIGKSDAAVLAGLSIAAVEAFYKRREAPPVLQQDDPLFSTEPICDLFLEQRRKG
jgi:hypothetical protein